MNQEKTKKLIQLKNQLEESQKIIGDDKDELGSLKTVIEALEQHDFDAANEVEALKGAMERDHNKTVEADEAAAERERQNLLGEIDVAKEKYAVEREAMDKNCVASLIR